MHDIFITSDQHFNHANILKFTDKNGNRIRPEFNSVEEMNEHMVECWNKTIKPGDFVYHLGDIVMGGDYDIINRLNGSKRLILGNHDDIKNPHLYNKFSKITVWRMFPEFKILLSHVPVHESSLGFKVTHNVHGHLHQNIVTRRDDINNLDIPDDRYINVCVEHTKYTPLHIEEIVKMKSF